MRQPIGAMAEVAVQTLMARIQRSEEPFEHRRFGAELVVRGSTGGALVATAH